MISITRREGAIGAAVFTAVVALALGGTALAGHLVGDVASYTGCVSSRGDLSKLQEGNTPLKPCSSGQVEVHLSGGDLTSVVAGTGLTGGAESGAATFRSLLATRSRKAARRARRPGGAAARGWCAGTTAPRSLPGHCRSLRSRRAPRERRPLGAA